MKNVIVGRSEELQRAQHGDGPETGFREGKRCNCITVPGLAMGLTQSEQVFSFFSQPNDPHCSCCQKSHEQPGADLSVLGVRKTKSSIKLLSPNFML